MRKLMLLAGVAALAASMPALADDRGRGRGNGQAAENSHKGGGHARGQRGRGNHHAERRGNRQERRAERRDDRQERRVERRGNRQERRVEHRLDRRERQIERAIQRERREVREARRDGRREFRQRGDDRREVRQVRREDRRDWRRWAERRIDLRDRFDEDTRRWRERRVSRANWRGDFCPPGLARQNRWCMPPGQLRRSRLIGQRLSFDSFQVVPQRYRYRFVDDNRFVYRYAPDGTILQFDRASGLVSSIMPVFATDLFLGEPLPLGYEVYNVPLAYRDYYPDGDDWLYRYDDGAIYQVDAETRLVEGIVALLTGGAGGLGALGIGDMLPSGYDAYNVPLDYRDTYYDSDEAMYRYADGSIYEVDPETQLITSIISLIA